MSKFAAKILSVISDYDDRHNGDIAVINTVVRSIQDYGVQVTFDYHSAQVIKQDKISDRGEMSDVLLFTPSSFISIECKFLENMTVSKDIHLVQDRIVRVKDRLNLLPIQILLMKEEKWIKSKSIPMDNTFYRQFITSTLKIPAVVLFWEDFVAITDNDRVQKYMNTQLLRRKYDSI